MVGGAEVTTSKPAHVDREGSTWVPPFRLRSGQSYTQQRQKCLCMAQRRRGEFRRSWHLIWGTSLGWRWRLQLAMFPWPWSGESGVRGLCVCACVCPDRGHNVVAHSDITHISSSTGQIKRLSAGTPEGLKKKRKWLFPADLCVWTLVITKPPLAAHCPSTSIKTPEH